MGLRLFTSFAGYDRGFLRGDLIAGLTVWAVLVPESLAYATIAGVPPVVGLYAAVPALTLYAIVGSSRHLIVGPMSATAALSAGVVGTVAANGGDYVATTVGLALAVGVMALLAGVLRLGFLASLISEPVLKGFIVGLALTIMIGQIPKLFGIEKGGDGFFGQVWHLLTHLDETKALSVAVGFGSLALLIILKRWLPFIPGSLAVAAASVAVTIGFNLEDHGLDIVGHIDSGLPSFGLPDLGGDTFLTLLGPAVGVMLVGFAEGLGAAKTYAAREGYDIDSNRELLGLGASNLGSGLVSGMVVNGSLSKTAVNGSAGAKSQFSAITAAALTLVTLLYLTGLFEQLPEATLAAIVVMAVVELVDIASLRRLFRVQTGRLASIYNITSRADFIAATAAMLGVLLFDTLPGLIIGICVSLVLLVARTSRPNVASLVRMPPGIWVDAAHHTDLPKAPGVLVVRIEAPLFFGNADFVRDRIRELANGHDTVHLVVIDGETSPSVDVSSADMLVQLRTDLQRQGADLVLAQEVGQARDVLDKATEHGEPAIFPTVDAAIASRADQ